MGCGQSTTIEDSAAKARSDMIERELKKTEKNLKQEIKILFLGAGGKEICSVSNSVYSGETDALASRAQNPEVS